jgi:hypothetical protein
MLLFQEDIEGPSVCEVELLKAILKFVATSKSFSTFSIVSIGSELGYAYTGVTPTASNTYLYPPEFASRKNKSNVNRNSYTHGLF